MPQVNQSVCLHQRAKNTLTSISLGRESREYHNSGVIYATADGAKKIMYEGPYPNVKLFYQDWLARRVILDEVDVALLDDVWNRWPSPHVTSAPKGTQFVHFAGPRRWLLDDYYRTIGIWG